MQQLCFIFALLFSFKMFTLKEVVMKKLILICSLMISSGVVDAFVIDQKGYSNKMAIPLKRSRIPSMCPYFSLAQGPQLKPGCIATKPLALRDAAQDTLNYIKKHEKNRKDILRPTSFSRDMMSLTKTKQTLRFIIDAISEDQKNGREQRISDPHFVKKHFGFIKWSGDKKGALRRGITLSNDRIRLTKYTVYHYRGSYKKQGKYTCALYRIPDSLDVPTYTKHQVIRGALNAHKRIRPLVWLTREGLEEALMQGTIFVHMTDGKLRAFNVHRNNGIDFDKSIKDSLQQKRYWYFKEYQGVDSTFRRYNKRREVVFAGDIRNIGVGKIIAINYLNKKSGKKELRLGVLADEGSAFDDNLYQLDFFVGVCKNKKALQLRIGKYPELVQAYVIYKKGSYHA